MKKLRIAEVQERANLMTSCEDLQDLKTLGFDVNQLIFQSLHPQYHIFQIPKKDGSYRQIEAPTHDLKLLQRQFSNWLQCVYYMAQPSGSYGYIIRVKGQPYEKNILGNARRHLGNAHMLHVDFKDFFHQVKRKQIASLFRTYPFQFSNKTAEVLARVFTLNNRLPMGAPSSPVLSNLYSIQLDKELETWASDRQAVFTRFVDDLNFSSNDSPFSMENFRQIEKICKEHGLLLNSDKTRIYGPEDEKSVTGLVLRETVDIEDAFYQELNKDLERLKKTVEVHVIMDKHRHHELIRDYKKEIDGKINFIGMIEGYDSVQFAKYRKKLKAALNPDEESLSVRWMHFNYF